MPAFFPHRPEQQTTGSISTIPVIKPARRSKNAFMATNAVGGLCIKREMMERIFPTFFLFKLHR
jgi:hypothetical protein